MKRRIHSSLNFRQLHYDFSEFSKVKAQLIANSHPAKQQDSQLNIYARAKPRCSSTGPSSFHTPANYLSMVSYSPQKPPPLLRIKDKTHNSYVSSPSFDFPHQQKNSKAFLSKFSKMSTHDPNAGKICKSCEEYNYRPRLFKRRK